MKWQRLWIGAGLVVALAAGCGGDDDVGQDNQEPTNQSTTNQENNDSQNQNQSTENQGGDDDFSETVDVWVGTVINNEDELTTLEEGQSFGGRFENDGAHFFELDLEAGQVLTLSKVGFEDDLEEAPQTLTAALYEPSFSGGVARHFYPEEHDSRQFFVTESGAHTLQVAHEVEDGERGENVGFALRAEISQVDDRSTPTWPGRTTDVDLSDGAIDAFEVSAEDDENVDLEIFAMRDPVGSELDALVYIWDVAAEEVIFDRENQTQDVYDPRLLFDVEEGRQYWVIVDSLFNVADADYEMASEFVGSTPTNPIELSIDGVDSAEGTIFERQSTPYVEYFSVTVEPGQYHRLTVEGSAELEPLMTVDDLASSAPSVNVQAVDNKAGVTLGLSEEATEPATYFIQMTDLQNGAGAVTDYVGGDDYGYVATLETVSPTTQSVSGEGSVTISLGEPGDVGVVDVTADADRLLWLDSGVDRQNLDSDELGASGFLPTWLIGDGSTLDWTESYFDGFYRSVGEEVKFMLRDRLFRGGPSYSAPARILAFDVTAPNFLNADLDAGAGSMSGAAELGVPAKLAGSLPGSDEEADPEQYHFTIEAQAGQFLVVSTENAPDTEVFLTLYDDQGDMVTEGSLLMEQIQEADGEDFFDSALVDEIDASGEYTLQIEQSCGWWGCDGGDVEIVVFLE